MTIELNHTIVHVKDRWSASRDVGHVLGLPEATAYGPFAELKLDNGVSLDFMDSEADIHGQHYAFLVGEDDFDPILGRLRDEGRQWWADPFKRHWTRSTTGTVAAASTGRALTGTGWRSSPVRTAPAADRRTSPSAPPAGRRRRPARPPFRDPATIDSPRDRLRGRPR